ncbi:MAG: ExbD/TolR family protein [Aquificaceae bacterium]
MEEKEIDYMNVIPLVDVMLVLLTISLIGASFIAVGSLPVNLPKAENQEVKKEQGIHIFITKEGKTLYGDKLLDREGLSLELASHSRETPIFLGADREVVVDSLVWVIDLLKGLGFQRIHLQVKRP